MNGGGGLRGRGAALGPQLTVAVIALSAGLGAPASGSLEILVLDGVFAGLRLLSAALLRKAAHEHSVGAAR